MKIRIGFVSNSSSSSFMVLGTKKAYDEAFKKLREAYKEVIARFTIGGTIGEQEVAGISYPIDLNEDYTDTTIHEMLNKYYSLNPAIEQPEDEDPWEILENFQNSMAEYGTTFDHSEGQG